MHIVKRCRRFSCDDRETLSSVLGMVCFSAAAWASTEYYRHVVFDNSLTPDSYFYSHGMANGSSFLELKDRPPSGRDEDIF